MTTAPPFPKGINPRSFLRRHRERGGKKFIYDLQAIADLFGVSVRAIQQLALRRRDFDPSSLESVCREYHRRHSKPTSANRR